MYKIPMKDEVSVHARFWLNVYHCPVSGCWLWGGYTDKQGYGRMNIDGKSYAAHRVVLVMHKIEIPDGVVIDHLCRNRCCVNPDHLRICSNRENILDRNATGFAAVNTRKPNCPKCGLPYSISPGRRSCVPCGIAYMHKYRANGFKPVDRVRPFRARSCAQHKKK